MVFAQYSKMTLKLKYSCMYSMMSAIPKLLHYQYTKPNGRVKKMVEYDNTTL